jgi:hypothetical protein
MKKLIFTVILFLIVAFSFLIFDSCSTMRFEQVGTIPVDLIHYIILGLLAIYEIIVRIIPSVGNYSIIAFIIKILKWLSDATNRTKSGS